MSSAAGELLRSWRNRRGLKQAQLARLVGREAQSISAYESGDNAPKPDIVRALDEALDAGGELLQAYGPTPMPAAPQMWTAIETLQQLVRKTVDRQERQVERLERQNEQIQLQVEQLARQNEQIQRRIEQLERRRGR